MFGIGFGELLVIGVLLLIAVGPRRMPVMMKSMGRAMREFRKAARELRAQVGLDELMGEDDVLRPMKKVPRPVRPATSDAAQNSAPSTTAPSAASSSTTQNPAPGASTRVGATEFDSGHDTSDAESIDHADEDDAQAAARARLREYPPAGVDFAESRDAAARASRASGAATTSAAANDAATNGSARGLASAPLASAKKAQA